MSDLISSHLISSHRISSHRITSHPISSDLIASHLIASHRMASSHRSIEKAKKCVSPLFEEFRQSSQDSCVSDQITEFCWDVCLKSPKSGFSGFWGKYINTCSRRIAPKKYQKVRFATFRGISTNVPGLLRFRSNARVLLGRLP